MKANCVPDVYLLPLETVLNPALTVYHRVLEKIGNFTATESLGPDPGADMPFFFLFVFLSTARPHSSFKPQMFLP